MIEFYSQVRLIHIAAVVASGGLFFVRGLAVQFGADWPTSAPLRYLSYGVDTILLTAALMLAEMLRQYPFVAPWINAKIVLLVVYIVLGGVALKRGRTRAIRMSCWVGALGTYALIVSIARAHHPLGVFRAFFG